MISQILLTQRALFKLKYPILPLLIVYHLIDQLMRHKQKNKSEITTKILCVLRGDHTWDLRIKFWKIDRTTTQETCNLNIFFFPPYWQISLLRLRIVAFFMSYTENFAPSMYYLLSHTLSLVSFRLLNICINCLHSLLLTLMTLAINFLPKEIILETFWNNSLAQCIKLGTSAIKDAASSNSQVPNRITWILIWCL